MIEGPIEVSIFVVAVLISLAVGVHFYYDAKAHERTAKILGEEIARAIHLTRDSRRRKHF
jgi:hypothetical protein